MREEVTMRLPLTKSAKPVRGALAAVLALLALAATPGAPTYAQAGAERVAGVINFGRVTERYFRGGKVTAEGVENLYKMGVRTIIDLRDDPSPGEPEACARLGILYHKFPMDGHARPDAATVERILDIIRSADAPVYVHCSAGKHRAGTVCALYRMRVQGWSPDRAWAEQQTYGFGPREEHPELFAFTYGGAEPKAADTPAFAVAASQPATVGAHGAPAGPSLSPSAGYVPLHDVIAQARAEGGSGDVLKVDLEYDIARDVATWDVTFSSGVEYEFDARSGAFLGSKEKSPAKIATMSPLGIERAGSPLKGFEDVMSRAASAANRAVLEMELKRIKGGPRTVFEVVFVDGVTHYYDAESGEHLVAM